jgi:hypothetical protein
MRQNLISTLSEYALFVAFYWGYVFFVFNERADIIVLTAVMVPSTQNFPDDLVLSTTAFFRNVTLTLGEGLLCVTRDVVFKTVTNCRVATVRRLRDQQNIAEGLHTRNLFNSEEITKRLHSRLKHSKRLLHITIIFSFELPGSSLEK